MRDFFNAAGEQGREEYVPVSLIAVEKQLRRHGGAAPRFAADHHAGEVRQGQQGHMVRTAPKLQQLSRLHGRFHLLHRDGNGFFAIGRSGRLLPEAKPLDELGKFQF
ncbi:hypothetical protein SDC9_199604 [bioreactor metagenome]|uniref:Uncharacterized protein n=1 Tax=bioreactor metagenome TaxID=1076179 RepID=A0A645IXM2_9ZZZZ